MPTLSCWTPGKEEPWRTNSWNGWLNNSTNDKQYRAILAEMKSLETLRDEIETTQLGEMEKIERAEAEAREATRAQVETEFGSLRTKLRELQGAIEVVRGAEAEVAQR